MAPLFFIDTSMNTGAALSRAFQLSIRHKTLWLVGLLPTLAGLAGILPALLLIGYAAFTQSRGGAEPGAVFALAVALAVLFAYAVITIATLWAQAGIIDAVRQIENTGSCSAVAALQTSGPRLPRLLGAAAVMLIPALVFLGAGFVAWLVWTAYSLPMNESATRSYLPMLLCGLAPFLCVAYAAIIGGMALHVYAERRIMLAGDGVLDALRNGLRMLRAHLADTLIIGVLMFGVQFVFQFITNLISQFGAIPLGIGAAMIGAETGSDMAGNVTIVLGTLCLVGVVTAISLPFGGWFATFSGATWTLAYMNAEAKNGNATREQGVTVSPQA